MKTRRLVIAAAAFVAALALFGGTTEAAVYTGYAPPLTDPASDRENAPSESELQGAVEEDDPNHEHVADERSGGRREGERALEG